MNKFKVVTLVLGLFLVVLAIGQIRHIKLERAPAAGIWSNPTQLTTGSNLYYGFDSGNDILHLVRA